MKNYLIKISGELLGENGFSEAKITKITEELLKIKKNNKLSVVLGGGNIWRKKDFKNLNFDDVNSDFIGMNSTIINAGVLSESLNKYNIKTKIFTPYADTQISEKYKVSVARHFLNEGINIFAGGIGSPFFTTDSTAVLRALEMQCDAILKATKVDGVYNKDPEKHDDAEKYEKLSFNEALSKNLKIMDLTAFSLAKENNLNIFVFKGVNTDFNNIFENGTWVSN